MTRPDDFLIEKTKGGRFRATGKSETGVHVVADTASEARILAGEMLADIRIAKKGLGDGPYQPPNSSGHQLAALDRVMVLSETFERHVFKQPFINSNPELSDMADHIGDLLGDFYQAIGSAKVSEMRCAECTCENGGDDCNWIKAPETTD